MTDNKIEPLYKKSVNSYDYICCATGEKCYLATKHFSEFKSFVQKLAKEQKNQTFCTGDENLCDKNNCPVYKNVMLKISEYAKSYVQKTK